MFTHLETILMSFANSVHISVFAFIASFVEEVIAPIPSPTVMMLTGSLAKVQEYGLLMLIPIALIASVGKMCGATVVYIVADRAEDFIMVRFGKFFGVTHTDVENLGKKIGKGFRSYVTLTILRALPFVPSVVVSAGSGMLKVPMHIFLITTFLGTIFRDGFYLYAGYVGATALFAIINKSSDLETYIEAGVVLAVLSYIGYRIYLRKKKTQI